MALQIWLPLDNTIKNQGIFTEVPESSNINIKSINGVPMTYFNNSYIKFSTGGYFNKEFSFSFWIYVDSLDTYSLWNWRDTAGGSIAVFIIDEQFRLDDGNQHEFSYIIPTKTLLHVALTRDASYCKLYVNGELKQSIASTDFTLPTNKIASIGCSSTKSNFGLNYLSGYLRDYRVYNHCLSTSEVVELSKGLYYHYPLNQPERSKNLVIGADKYTFSNPLTHTGKNKDDIAYYYDMVVPNVTNKTITVSVCCDGNIASSHVTTETDPKNKLFTFWIVRYNKNNEIVDHYCFTETNASHKQIGKYLHRWNITIASGIDHLLFRTNLYSNGTDSYTLKFWNIKVEEGVNNNPQWTPNEDAWDNIEYDTSGNVNNIHVLDELLPTYASDTPKYNICYNFTDAGQIINTTSHIKPTRNVSISAWVKATSIESVTEPSVDVDGINIYVNNAGVIHLVGTFGDLNSSVSCIDTWCYVVGTYDGTTVKLYVNGELKASKAYTSDLQYIKGAAISSDSKSGISCKVSDFRVYLSALTELEIKDMSNTKISNNGIALTSEFIE